VDGGKATGEGPRIMSKRPVKSGNRRASAPGPWRAPPQMAVSAPLPKDVKVSFEFFPPKTEKANQTLWECIQRLAPLKPAYVSVTYGAGGSTRERTHATVYRIRCETDLEPAAHLTCVGSSRTEIDDVARGYWDAGVRHIVALRGDPPEGAARYQPYPSGYAYASELVAGLKKVAPFEISVAAYPEVHPEASSAAADLDNLKRKIDAGASAAITQFFFDIDVYLRFLERARKAGISLPIIPGILPVMNFARVAQFCSKCGASVPRWMADLFEGLDDDPETRTLVAASVAAEQCRALSANGVGMFHFYTMNRADLVFAICHILGVRAQPATAGIAAAGSSDASVVASKGP
jgi:methylenetetrahydrofolate reductase (NADPH)